MRRAGPLVRAFVVAVVALLPAIAGAAPDCDGGSIRLLRIAGVTDGLSPFLGDGVDAAAPGVQAAGTPRGIQFKGTVTRAGATHASLVAAPPGLTLAVVNADGGVPLYTVTIPPERFVSGARATRYDGAGAFHGRVVLRNSRRQRDTVEIVVEATDERVMSLPEAVPLRVEITTAGGCARTCVADCRVGARGLRCARSDRYVPFPDLGIGAPVRGERRPGNPLCGLAIDTSRRCDFLVEERCILPYPSSYFLVPDASTATGVRLDYPADALPQNTMGVYIDPADWNTLDGFSPGPMILALFPDTGFPVDLAASNAAFHTDFARSLDPDHPTVLLDAHTGERIPHFVELDANTTDVTKRTLIIRPARRLADGTRYIVAIRGLVDMQGTPIGPRLAFRALRDGEGGAQLVGACGPACAAALDARQPQFADIFARLGANGVSAGDLVLAWDFTTASTQELTGWIVAVRDQAFALGTPAFTITRVDDGGGAGLDANIWAEIEGTFQAPLFMTADAPASRLNLVGDVPAQNGFATVPFVAEIPRSVYQGGPTTPGRPSLWGHGLLGDRFQVRGLSPFANEYGFVMAAVDMQGMSGDDLVPAIVPLIRDLSKFHFIPERLHQGFLNHLLLGRLLVDPVNGFNAHAAFRPGGSGVIDTTAVYYSGGSQGGIFGMAIMSIAEDFERGFLAVPGANYSTLLHRSIDFDPYLALSRTAYPDRLDEQLTIALIQQLWDRAEPQGYMNHLASGDLSSPPVPHKVLIHMATCDSQVSNLATEIMVRSIGIPQVPPVNRSFFAISETPAPFDGSAFVEIDWQKCGARCNVPGGDNPGAACTTNADCPGPGDPPSRTRCDSGTPPLTNTAPPFENDAHGAEGDAPPTSPVARQVDAFLSPGGNVQQFCTGACDPD
jgi:hypothetical protein